MSEGGERPSFAPVVLRADRDEDALARADGRDPFVEKVNLGCGLLAAFAALAFVLLCLAR